MKYFELELESRGTTFFGGEEHPKMLDYMIWPWLERADIVPLINRSLELLPKSNFPLLVTTIFQKSPFFAMLVQTNQSEFTTT